MASKAKRVMHAVRRLNGDAFREGGMAFHPQGDVNLHNWRQYSRTSLRRRDDAKLADARLR